MKSRTGCSLTRDWILSWVMEDVPMSSLSDIWTGLRALVSISRRWRETRLEGLRGEGANAEEHDENDKMAEMNRIELYIVEI